VAGVADMQDQRKGVTTLGSPREEEKKRHQEIVNNYVLEGLREVGGNPWKEASTKQKRGESGRSTGGLGNHGPHFESEMQFDCFKSGKKKGCAPTAIGAKKG